MKKTTGAPIGVKVDKTSGGNRQSVAPIGTNSNNKEAES